MKAEILRLRKKLSEQEKKLHSTVKRLHSTNQLKENMEKVIIDQCKFVLSYGSYFCNSWLPLKWGKQQNEHRCPFFCTCCKWHFSVCSQVVGTTSAWSSDRTELLEPHADRKILCNCKRLQRMPWKAVHSFTHQLIMCQSLQLPLISWVVPFQLLPLHISFLSYSSSWLRQSYCCCRPLQPNFLMLSFSKLWFCLSLDKYASMLLVSIGWLNTGKSQSSSSKDLSTLCTRVRRVREQKAQNKGNKFTLSLLRKN